MATEPARSSTSLALVLVAMPWVRCFSDAERIAALSDEKAGQRRARRNPARFVGLLLQLRALRAFGVCADKFEANAERDQSLQSPEQQPDPLRQLKTENALFPSRLIL